jgi:tryptophan synthase alpha chain
MRTTVEASRGFVYGVSVMGITGARTSVGRRSARRRR